MRNKFISFLLGLFLLIPLVRADIVWPALFLEEHILKWYVIGAGLVIEYFFILRLLKVDFKKAILITFTMNLISTLLGFILIPLGGIIWELFPMSLIFYFFNIGTFNPITWIATSIIATFINTFIEYFSIKWIFKMELGKRIFWWLGLANLLSVALALISLIYLGTSY